MFNWSQEQALQLVMFHIATQSEITSFFRGVFLSPVNVFSCPLSLASKSRDCVTTEINTGARGSSGSTCLTGMINVQNCCLMLFLTWNPQIDLCYRQSDYCALIQSKTLCQRKLLELIFCGKEINFIVFEIIITTVCAVASCEKLTTDKRATEQLKQGSFHKQASRYVVRHFQAKVSVHFNSPCLIVLVDIVNWFWNHLN